MPKLTGILETALYVEDLDRAEAFYAGVLDMPRVTGDDRFRALRVGESQILLLFLRGASRNYTEIGGSVVPAHNGEGELHMALSIDAADLEGWLARLDEAEVEVESRLDWPEGSTSLFFRDPDRNLIELATPGLWPGD